MKHLHFGVEPDGFYEGRFMTGGSYTPASGRPCCDCGYPKKRLQEDRT